MPRTEHRERPLVTVDVVVVAWVEKQRKVLLVRRNNPPFEGCWALPGGFVEPNEPLSVAARRELREETGIELARLEQLHTFGDPGRDPRGWTISVTYLALVGEAEVRALQPQAGDDASEADWFGLEDLPPLAFDHHQILAHATRSLAATAPVPPAVSHSSCAIPTC